jgi:hypothetical protein
VIVEPRFLTAELATTSALALNAVRLETGHMGAHVMEMLALLRPATVNRDLNALLSIAQADDRVDLLQQRIYEYLAQVRSGTLTDADSATFQQLMNGTAYIENAGDVVATELVPLIRELVTDRGNRLLAAIGPGRILGPEPDHPHRRTTSQWREHAAFARSVGRPGSALVRRRMSATARFERYARCSHVAFDAHFAAHPPVPI